MGLFYFNPSDKMLLLLKYFAAFKVSMLKCVHMYFGEL